MQQKRRIKVCQSLDLESPETSYSDIELMLLQYLYTCIRMCTVLQWTLGICTCLMDVDLTATFLQRLVRRYLFKLERQKDEGASKFCV